jgi:cobalt-zinc-cadmium efflux system protein
VVLIFVEAVSRLLEPAQVQGLGVALVAAAGLLVNLAVLYLIGKGDQDLNTRAATLHVFGDLIGSVAALTSGAVIYYTGWQPIDPLLSILIALLILASTLRLLREAVHVLMEGVPAGIQLGDVGVALARFPACGRCTICTSGPLRAGKWRYPPTSTSRICRSGRRCWKTRGVPCAAASASGM